VVTAVLDMSGVVGVTGTEFASDFLIVAIVDVLIAYHQADRSAGGEPTADTGEYFHPVLLAATGGGRALSGASFIKLRLYIGFVDSQTGRATINDNADALTVALAVTGYGE
jgi:hypothetical protein